MIDRNINSKEQIERCNNIRKKRENDKSVSYYYTFELDKKKGDFAFIRHTFDIVQEHRDQVTLLGLKSE